MVSLTRADRRRTVSICRLTLLQAPSRTGQEMAVSRDATGSSTDSVLTSIGIVIYKKKLSSVLY